MKMLTDEEYSSLARKAVANARKELAENKHKNDSQKAYHRDSEIDDDDEVFNKKVKNVTEYYEDVNNMDLSQLIAAELETPFMSDDEDEMSYPKMITYDTHSKPSTMNQSAKKVQTLQSKGEKIKKHLSKKKKPTFSNSSINKSSNTHQPGYSQLSDEKVKQETLNYNKKQERKRRKEKMQCLKTVFMDRHIPERGVWVQCTRADCMKWRYLADATDPSTIPELWSCEQNSEPNFNSCDKPEADWERVAQQQGFVDTKFTVGSIVWAKLSGYPWWPAMVEEDPNVGEYFWLVDEWRSVPSDYHVVFLDKNVTRAWINRTSIKVFTSPQQSLGVVKVKGKLLAQLQEAKQAAVRAKALPIKDRIVEYGFSSHFKGKWGGADLSLTEEFKTEWPGHGEEVKVDTIKQKNEDDEMSVESNSNEVVEICSQNMEILKPNAMIDPTEKGVAGGIGIEQKSESLLKKEKTRKRKNDKSNHLKMKKSRKGIDNINHVGSNRYDTGNKHTSKESHSEFDFNDDDAKTMEVAENQKGKTKSVVDEDIKAHVHTDGESEGKGKKMKKKKKQKLLEDRSENTGPIGTDQFRKCNSSKDKVKHKKSDSKGMKKHTENTFSKDAEEAKKLQAPHDTGRETVVNNTVTETRENVIKDVSKEKRLKPMFKAPRKMENQSATSIKKRFKPPTMKDTCKVKANSTSLEMNKSKEANSTSLKTSKSLAVSDNGKSKTEEVKQYVLSNKGDETEKQTNGEQNIEPVIRNVEDVQKESKNPNEEKVEGSISGYQDQNPQNNEGIADKSEDSESTNHNGCIHDDGNHKHSPDMADDSMLRNDASECQSSDQLSDVLDPATGKKKQPEDVQDSNKADNNIERQSLTPESDQKDLSSKEKPSSDAFEVHGIISPPKDVNAVQASQPISKNEGESLFSVGEVDIRSDGSHSTDASTAASQSARTSDAFEFLGSPSRENQVVPSNENQLDMDYVEQQTLASISGIDLWDHTEPTKCATEHDIDQNDSQPFEIEE